MERIWDFAVIGGGASGMAAAVAASALGDDVILLEKGPALGRKLNASGNGRCNLMNTGAPAYFGDVSFAADVLGHYPRQALIQFMRNLGIFLAEDAEGRVYPGTFHAPTVTDALKAALKMNGVSIRLQTAVTHVLRNNDVFVILAGTDEIAARRILIACGGAASPKLGGTSAGYELLSSLGHPTLPVSPALCPLTADARDISGLAGLRVRCAVSLYSSGQTLICRHKGEVLFTDYGISGICAMQCARRIDGKGCTLELDLLDPYPAESSEFPQILRERAKRFAPLPAEQLLSGILMPRLSFAVMKQAGIEMRNRTCGDLTDAETDEIARRIRRYTLHITGTKGMEEAQVTAGGADCRGFDPATLASRTVPGLHAAGEVLNVDGDCGGFNLMFAFTSGILAGRNGRTGEEKNP